MKFCQKKVFVSLFLLLQCKYRCNAFNDRFENYGSSNRGNSLKVGLLEDALHDGHKIRERRIQKKEKEKDAVETTPQNASFNTTDHPSTIYVDETTQLPTPTNLLTTAPVTTVSVVYTSQEPTNVVKEEEQNTTIIEKTTILPTAQLTTKAPSVLLITGSPTELSTALREVPTNATEQPSSSIIDSNSRIENPTGSPVSTTILVADESSLIDNSANNTGNPISTTTPVADESSLIDNSANNTEIVTTEISTPTDEPIFGHVTIRLIGINTTMPIIPELTFQGVVHAFLASHLKTATQPIQNVFISVDQKLLPVFNNNDEEIPSTGNTNLTILVLQTQINVAGKFLPIEGEIESAETYGLNAMLQYLFVTESTSFEQRLKNSHSRDFFAPLESIKVIQVLENTVNTTGTSDGEPEIAETLPPFQSTYSTEEQLKDVDVSVDEIDGDVTIIRTPPPFEVATSSEQQQGKDTESIITFGSKSEANAPSTTNLMKVTAFFSGLSLTTIIGIVVGTVVIFVTLTLFTCCYCVQVLKRKKSSDQMQNLESYDSTDGLPTHQKQKQQYTKENVRNHTQLIASNPLKERRTRGYNSDAINPKADHTQQQSNGQQGQSSNQFESQSVGTSDAGDSYLYTPSVVESTVYGGGGGDSISYAYSLDPGVASVVGYGTAGNSSIGGNNSVMPTEINPHYNSSRPDGVKVKEISDNSFGLGSGTWGDDNFSSVVTGSGRSENSLNWLAQEQQRAQQEHSIGDDAEYGGGKDQSADCGGRRASMREIFAPPGKLGIVIDTTLEGPIVHQVNTGSPLQGIIWPGDIIIAIDNVETRAMDATSITELMIKTANQKRKLTIVSQQKLHG